MTTYLRRAVIGVVLALGAAAHAQVTYTNSNPVLGSITLGSTGNTVAQTFTGFSNISQMSWQVINNSGSAQTATFNAYIGQWNTATSSLVGSLTAFGTVGLSSGSIGAGATTTLTFTDTWSTVSPSLTYGLILSYAGGSTDFGAQFSGTNPGGAFFGPGMLASRNTSSALGTFVTDLQSAGGASSPGLTYSMSVTGELASTPEPQTAATIFAVVFVAGMVGRRTWQRRKAAAVPLAA